MVSVNDVGKAVNPQQVEGQIEGAVAQAIGWTLLEDFIQREGKTLTPHLSSYLIPGVLDVAAVIEPVILEFPDPQGPFGARGMAEMPFIPTAPAIAAAIHDATGIWIDQLPYTPPHVWAALYQASPDLSHTRPRRCPQAGPSKRPLPAPVYGVQAEGVSSQSDRQITRLPALTRP